MVIGGMGESYNPTMFVSWELGLAVDLWTREGVQEGPASI